MAESKRLKRLEKNRESARECRRRKKENKERVEAQLASLEVGLATQSTVRLSMRPLSTRCSMFYVRGGRRRK